MALAISTDDNTEILARVLHVEGLDKSHLKDGTLLTTGMGELHKVVDAMIVRSYKITGIIDYEDGGVEFLGKPIDMIPHPASSVETFSLS